jgi:probable HAF family extracellular repeat protein
MKENSMSNHCKALLLSLILAFACLPLAAQTYTFQALSLPYAPQSDTFASGINNRGAVVGYFYSPNGKTQGFKRNADGVFELPFDDPNARSQTYPLGIDDSGVIVGYYIDANYSYIGFLRDQGVFTDFSVKTGPGEGTYIYGINNKGDFVGQSVGVDGELGFVDSGGVVSQFAVPGSDQTSANGIAADGTIVGNFAKNSMGFGFVRGPAGRYKTFKIPGTAVSMQASAINNAAHKIVGSYTANYTGIWHGFVYDYITDVITTVDWPDPNTLYTIVTGINSHGVIVGWVNVSGHTLEFSFIGTPQ